MFFIDSLKSIGGAEQMFIDQANYFSEKGIDVFFALSHAYPNPKDFSSKIRIHKKVAYFRFKTLHDIRSYLAFRRYIKIHKIDVLYSYLDYSNNIARMMKFFLPRLRVCIIEPGDPRRKTTKMRVFDWCMNFFTYKIFAMSGAVRDQLCAYLKVHSRKILAMRNGVHPMLTQGEVDEKYKKSDQAVIQLLHVGNIRTENKGHRGMIDVMKYIKDHHSDVKVHLSFIGDGSLRKGFEDLVASYGLQDRVTFVGIVPHEEISLYYKKTDIFIFNSKTEGGAASIMEATSAGLPTVSSLFESAHEVVVDGVTGHLVPWGNIKKFAEHVTFLSLNFEKRSSMGYAAYDLYRERFIYDRLADGFISKLSL